MQISLDLGKALQRNKARLTTGADGAFLLASGAAPGVQAVELRHSDLARAALRLSLRLRPEPAGKADFVLLNADNALIARVDRDGTLQVSPEAEVQEAHCSADASGWWQLDLHFRNFAPGLLLGLGQPGLRHAGSGQPQFALRDLRVEVIERRWVPSPEDGLVVLETGMGARPDRAWEPYLPSLRPIICEANEAAGRAALSAWPAEAKPNLVPHALSNRGGLAKLNIARSPAASSLLDPELRRLKPFASASGFEVVEATKVQTTRFDSLSRQLNLPQPDLLRIRAGGAEFDVLRGCGDVLDGVLGIEVQVYFYPLYRKQKLIGDVIDLLDGYGFALRRLQPHPVAGTAHEVAAATAYLSKRKVEGAALGKVAFIEEVWGVSWPR